MKKLIIASVVTLAASVFAKVLPPTTVGTKANPSAIHIQRTLKLMEESTAAKPATVRILFYGQSIVAQPWTREIMKTLQEKYPTVKFIWENRAIGGFTSPALIRTAESDLYPFYPDLLFFHVYGPLDKYEGIVKKTRETTSAEIILWTSHLSANQSAADMLAKRDNRSLGIIDIAKRYNCMVVDLNKKWSEMLVANNWEAKELLADGVHMSGSTDAFKYYAGFIAEEMQRIKGAKGEPNVSGTITEIDVKNRKFVKVAADGSIRLNFDGNRVVAVSDGSGKADVTAEVLLDKKPAASYAEMYYNSRPSTSVMWMPAVRHVDCAPGVLPNVESWTLTYLDGTTPDGQLIKFRVEGSVTGIDGEGDSHNDFKSNSGRAIMSKDDYGFSWQYNYAVNNQLKKTPDDPKLLAKLAKPGFQIKWETRALFANPFKVDKKDVRTVLVQNCTNGKHTLVLKTKGGKLGIGKFIVYKPAATKYEIKDYSAKKQ